MQVFMCGGHCAAVLGGTAGVGVAEVGVAEVGVAGVEETAGRT